MRSISHVFIAALPCFAVMTVALTAPGAARAADSQMSPGVAKSIQDAIKAANAKDYQTALADIKQAQAIDSRTDFDNYKINAMLAYVAIAMKDYPTATAATEAAADSPALPDGDKKDTYRNALLLAGPAKQYQKAIDYGQKLAALNALDASTEAVLAQAYYFTQDSPHAQQYAQMSIDASKAAGQPPLEGALDIALGNQSKPGGEQDAQQEMEKLAVNLNKPESWSNLVNIALSAKGVTDSGALHLLRLKMFIPASMSGDDYITLASAADELGYPTEAYGVLQKGISSGKISAAQTGDLYTHARDGAAADQRALSASAAKAEHDKSGEQDIKLAEDYWGYGNYAEAEAVARRAVSEGGLKDPGEGLLLAGMTEVAQGKYDDAIVTLNQVSGTPTRARTAHLWSLFAQAQKKQPAGSAG